METKNKIRILHIAQAAGGVARYIEMLIKNLDANQFENILICSYDYNEHAIAPLVESFEQIYMQREIEFSNELKAIIQIRKLIKKYKPDIIYAHSSKAGALGRVANIGFSSICIYNPHGWAFNMNNSKTKKLVYTLIERILSRFCEKIVCISEAEKDSALSHSICKENKLQVIYNGIDIEDYKKSEGDFILTRSSIGIPEDSFVVGMVGRLAEQKSPDIFVRAAKQIKELIPNATFLIVGDGEERREIEDYAEKNGFHDSLIITGWVNEPMQYIKLFDVACLLSRWEGFGLVLPEYMVAEKPIIATMVDAIPNIIRDYENGLLVPPDNPQLVGDAVLELYRNPELANKLVKSGVEDVKSRFDVKRVSSEHGMMFEIAMRTKKAMERKQHEDR